jgi:RNA ligase (TIGR02306 family)
MRKMATLRQVIEIKSIPDADLIVAYRVDGWWVVDKKGSYTVGDLVVYCEIDGWVPNSIAPFLSKGKEPREFEGVKGERLRTIRLKGQLSQGLLLPPTVLTPYPIACYFNASKRWGIGIPDEETDGFSEYILVDDDVSERLNIKKWEPYINPQIAGQMRGNFPGAVPKTDAERIQNINRNIEKYKELGYTFSKTEKIDGSSTTFYLDDQNDFHVCSRNWDLKDEGDNVFWNMAKKYSIEQKMKDLGLTGYAIQGETYGASMNGNIYMKRDQDFIMFSLYNVNKGSYETTEESIRIADMLEIPFVPIIDLEWKQWDTIDAMLIDAEFKSNLNKDTDAEGIVYRCNEDPNITFKCISNKYLLKKKE